MKSKHFNEIVVDRCPHRRAFVLDHGIIGNTPTGDLVSCRLSRQGYITLLDNLFFSFSMSRVRYTNATSLSPRENV